MQTGSEDNSRDREQLPVSSQYSLLLQLQFPKMQDRELLLLSNSPCEIITTNNKKRVLLFFMLCCDLLLPASLSHIRDLYFGLIFQGIQLFFRWGKMKTPPLTEGREVTHFLLKIGNRIFPSESSVDMSIIYT